MDAYLASGNLRDSYTFYFNLNMELLKGCQFSCAGCHVNKEGTETFTDQDYEHLKSVMQSFTTNNSYKPFIAFIAPTDFLTATNTVEVLSDPRVVEILRYFKRLSFQTTYLNLNSAERVAAALREHYGDMELEINILIEPEKIENDKYLQTLQKNQNAVHTIFNWPSPIRRFGIMNVFDYRSTKVADLLSDYDYMHKKVSHLFETTIDFNFSMGRKDENLTSDEFKFAAEQVKDLFNNSVSETTGEYLRFSFGRLHDSLVEKQYNWKGGDFYYSPLLYERYVSFISALKIPLIRYDAAEFEQFEHQVMISQYANVEDKTECGDCPFLGSCVDRGILHLMDIHNIKDCLVSKNALSVVNSMGTLPYEH